MITYVPNYYKKFKCIADKCKHTCCKGWEIDVDEESMRRFEGHEDIISRIEGNSFVLLGSEERCPFLRDDLLCQMIIDHGEDFICDICKDHPRFRNYYEDRIEMGIGLCCEAACDLIIDNKDTFALVPESELSDSICILNNRNIDIMERLIDIAQGNILDSNMSLAIYSDMEYLDADNKALLLNCVRDLDVISSFIREHNVEFEQIAVYFAYRYPSMPAFAVEASKIIAGCSITLGGSIDTIKEAARIYSSEVEYSDINMEIVEDNFLFE